MTFARNLEKTTMFESIIASVLNNVLGKYIKDLDSSNLRLGILKGKETRVQTTVAKPGCVYCLYKSSVKER